LSGGESGQGWNDLFIAVEGGSQAVRGGCGFNALVSAWEGRRRNEVLPEAEAEATNSFGSMGRKHDMIR
jgi:hypothetical protein